MSKILALTIFAVLTANVSLAEVIEHPRNLKEEARIQSKVKQRLMWSTVAVVAASFADAHSSWGKRESNSLLQSNNGTFGAKGFALKMGMVGGFLLGQHLMIKANPNLAKPFTYANFGFAGLKTAVAVRNYQISRPAYLLRPE
ncbi:MAG: hypothetical protein OHK0021_00450 [Bryobacter sp.]|nr:hypothetical protein [Bryobacter sp.]